MKKRLNQKMLFFWSATAIIVLLVFAVIRGGPTHGFFAEEIDTTQIPEQDWYDTVSLENDYEMTFTPVKNHFAGFSIYLKKQPGSSGGTLMLEITDSCGKTRDNIAIDLQKMPDSAWYKLHTDAKLQRGEIYTLTFRVQNCTAAPCLQRINPDLLPAETTTGDVLLSYAYTATTFNLESRALLLVCLLALWLFMCSFFIGTAKKKYCRIVCALLLITAILAWNYAFNSMDNQNTIFYGFQYDSEELVNRTLTAQQDGIYETAVSPYGLAVEYEGRIFGYTSQYGLQGRIFKIPVNYIPVELAGNLERLGCCLATAFVFAVIVLLLYYKYNALMAGCFLVTFWLSPWIVNFARNLYWVEFTWFVPMAAGLLCAWKIHSRWCRIASYILVFIACMIKCLCGYESISTIMLGSIAFLLTDFVAACTKKKKGEAILLFRTLILFGLCALAGFVAALCMHAHIRGGGDIAVGIKNIFQQDVLRRTYGANLNNYGAILWDSINASVWETLCLYFHFSTQIITGIPGNLFALLCMIPLCIFGYECSHKKADYELMSMYVIFFLTSISWFCLAKSHSYVHTHMNFVLWYFGFVQVCFYTIVSRGIAFIKGNGYRHAVPEKALKPVGQKRNG